MAEDLKQLYTKTAQVLGRQKETIASLSKEAQDLKEKVQTFENEKRALSLAETAIELGHIPEDYPSVKKFASDILKSGKSMDMIEQSLKYRVPSMNTFEKGAEEIGSDPADPFKDLVGPYFG